MSELERRIEGCLDWLIEEGFPTDCDPMMAMREAAAALGECREALGAWAGADGGGGLHLGGCGYEDGRPCDCGLDKARAALARLSPGAAGGEGIVADEDDRCRNCNGLGTYPLPRGMSGGFYRFMAAGCVRRDDGTLLMTCPRCNGTGRDGAAGEGGDRGG